MAKKRPSVFIGSSGEGLPVAKAVQVNLDRCCEVVLWSQGVFGLNGGTLETLVNKAAEFDFAIIVITPDDMIESRGTTHASARDNVLIELGLFVGTIGRERTFVMFDRSANIKIPSDLAGITHADYELHATGNLDASVGAACTRIENEVTRLGPVVPPGINFDVNPDTHFQDISNLLDIPARQILILMQEQNVQIRRIGASLSAGLHYDYVDLRNGSSGRGTFDVDKLCNGLADAGLLQQDLRNMISLTDHGREFARWLTDRGHKIGFFKSNVGGWGDAPPGWPDYQAMLRDRADSLTAAQRWGGVPRNYSMARSSGAGLPPEPAPTVEPSPDRQQANPSEKPLAKPASSSPPPKGSTRAKRKK